MDIDTIFQKIDYKKKYTPEQLYDFTKDESFLEYLKNYYPGIYDFYKNSNFQYSNNKTKIKTKTAAVSVCKKQGVSLYINQVFFTQIREICKDNIKDFYDILKDIIYHEELHFVLAHFRIPREFINHTILNYAQDIVIDNFIYEIDPKWRNWKYLIDKINAKIDETDNKSFRKISLNKGDKNYILNFNDLDIYYYLLNFCNSEELEKIKRIDDHSWTNSNNQDKQKQGEGGDNKEKESQEGESGDENKKEGENGRGEEKEGGKDGNENQDKQKQGEGGDNKEKESQEGESGNENKKESGNGKEDENEENEDKSEEIFEKLAAGARARIASNSNRTIYNQYGIGGGVDEVIKRVADGKEHNLFNILKKYIKKISYKQKNYTWKKINKRQPLLKPGFVLKKQPGEVLLVLDTSKSMHKFINDHLKNVINEIYIAFKKIAHLYGVPSTFFQIDSDSMVLAIKEIKEIEELENFKIKLGGGTDFKPVFDIVLNDWRKKYSKHNQKVPDFILFITDLGADLDFLENNEYAIFADKLIWLVTGEFYKRPSIGTVINVFANDWKASTR
jgi:hypothetical protein